MTAFEIILLILGIAFVIISFFMVDNKPKGSFKDRVIPDATEFEKIRTQTVELSQREVGKIVQEAEDKLENLSNDKIIAVGEYSDQIMEKIKTDHQEVVFLYQMLQDKEEELKETIQKIDNVRVECEQLIREQEKKAEAIKEQSRKAEPAAQEAVKTAVKAPATKTVKKVVPAKPSHEASKSIQAPKPVKAVDSRDTMMLSRNDEIIALYKENKSVMEISKLLKMGQGEVKLIIDLYCK